MPSACRRRGRAATVEPGVHGGSCAPSVVRDPARRLRSEHARGSGLADPDAPSMPRAAFAAHRYDAVLFDLDGVLDVDHRPARRRAGARRSTACSPSGAPAPAPQAPFDRERDYVAHLDGKPRYDGVRDFLRSRGHRGPRGPRRQPGGRVVRARHRQPQAGARGAGARPGRRRGLPRLGRLGPRSSARSGVLHRRRDLERERRRRSCAPPASATSSS